MAPRTFQWPKRESSLPNDTSNLVALVFENSEVFESEAAELTIEESDDYSSSLLLRNDWSSTESNLSELSISNRNPSIAHSAHSLATTSIVASTQHAHIVEFSLLSVPATLSSTENYLSNLKVSMNTKPATMDYRTKQEHEISISREWNHSAPDIVDKIEDFIRSSSVHVLNHTSSIPVPPYPASWPRYLLAHTDAPGLVQAIQRDMTDFWSNLFKADCLDHRSIPVLPCDEASDLTTCQLTCCEADVEILDCVGSVATNTDTATATGNTDGSDQEVALVNTTTQTSHANKRCNSKRTRPQDNLFILGYNQSYLRLLDSGRIFLASYSGIQPELNDYNSIKSSHFTAVYLLLVPDPCTAPTSKSHSSTRTDFISTASSKRPCLSPEHDFPLLSELDNHLHNSTSNNKNLNEFVVLAMLSQLVPSFQYSGLCRRPINLNHPILESDFVRLNATCASNQNFTALIALVDLVPVYDDSGIIRPKVIIHQRLHYAPGISFRLQPCS